MTTDTLLTEAADVLKNCIGFTQGEGKRIEEARDKIIEAIRQLREREAKAEGLDAARYVLVPREPTPEMIMAAATAKHMDDINGALEFMQLTRGVKYSWSGHPFDSPLAYAYRAMIDAAILATKPGDGESHG